MPDVEAIMARLRSARSVPELLEASFDAFETIRVLARSSEDIAPSLLAAFMTVADAAIDGRQAITLAPSLFPASGVAPVTTPPAVHAGIDTITDALAALGELLCERLVRAADCALTPSDRAACQEAAAVGHRVHQLMAREDK